MKILVFTEGTCLKPSDPDKPKQYASYCGTTSAAKKVRAWNDAGVEIHYLTSRIDKTEIAAIRDVLKRSGFVDGPLHARADGESYVKVVERLDPDILVEDDCKSIGVDQIIGIQLNPAIGILSVVVPEFGGLEHLPDNPYELLEK
jgi:hypothetical protein